MHKEDVCETEVLAKSRFCAIARCSGCRSFHLHFGSVSLRLREEVFRDICETMAGVYLRVSDESCNRTAQNH